MQPKWLANQLNLIVDDASVRQRIYGDLGDELRHLQRQCDDGCYQAQVIVNDWEETLRVNEQQLSDAVKQLNKLRAITHQQQQQQQDSQTQTDELDKAVKSKQRNWEQERSKTSNELAKAEAGLANAEAKLTRAEAEERACEQRLSQARTNLNTCESSYRYETIYENGRSRQVRVKPDCSMQWQAVRNAEAALRSAQQDVSYWYKQVGDYKSLIARLRAYLKKCQQHLSNCAKAVTHISAVREQHQQQQQQVEQQNEQLQQLDDVLQQYQQVRDNMVQLHKQQQQAELRAQHSKDGLISDERNLANSLSDTDAQLFMLQRALQTKAEQLLAFDRKLFS